MEQQKYLIDTNVVIDYLAKNLPPSGMGFMDAIIDSIPNISVITKIEVLGFNSAGEYAKLLINFIGDSKLFHLTESVIDKSIEIRKRRKTKLPDVVIAATAVVYGLVLITRNESDFQNIRGLRVINPHNIEGDKVIV